MKKFLSTFLATLLVLTFATSCGKKSEKAKLKLYNWGDYLSASVVKKFEKEFNCQIIQETFDSNEAMYAKIKAGATQFDVLVPSCYMVNIMVKQDMLLKLDKTLLPNVTKYINRTYLSKSLDKDMDYSVPYLASFTGIGYNSKILTTPPKSWRVFENTKYVKRCSLLNDQREVLGIALKTLNLNPNSTKQEDIDKAVALVRSWKKNIAKFEVDNAIRSLASGEFHVIHTYSGDVLQLLEDYPNISFTIPQEGGMYTLDNFVILKNSSNKTLAHNFINFMHRPDIAAENMNGIRYYSPNIEAQKFVDETLRKNPAFTVSAEDFNRCSFIEDLGDNNKIFYQAWEKVKAQ
jgi:spermidine/putrescine transport system substrate-binding protein